MPPDVSDERLSAEASAQASAADGAPTSRGRRSRAALWAAGVVVCGMMGRSEGLWEAQRAAWLADRMAPRAGAATSPSASDRRLALALANTAFRESIDTALARRGAPLHFVAWEWGRDGSLILDIQRSNLTWAALSATERAGLMALIAASYTAFLVRMQIPVDLAERGHPVVALAYEGDDHALAIRSADGRVHVYGSPGDGAPGSSPADPASR